MSAAPTSEITKTKPGLISAIGFVYVALGVLGVALAVLRVRFGAMQLTPVDAIGPGLLVVAAIGAISRKPWGRWMCYLFSAFLLLGVPIGTLLGGMMIYHLTKYRSQFVKDAS